VISNILQQYMVYKAEQEFSFRREELLAEAREMIKGETE
jgi:hypothetical protein